MSCLRCAKFSRGVAALATIADFVLDKREKYKRQRMAREKERPAATGPPNKSRAARQGYTTRALLVPVLYHVSSATGKVGS